MGDVIRWGNFDIECLLFFWLFGEFGEDLGVIICLEGGDIEDDDFGFNFFFFILIERFNFLVCFFFIFVLVFDVVEKEDFGLLFLDVFKFNGMFGEFEVEIWVFLSFFGGVLCLFSVGNMGCIIIVG